MAVLARIHFTFDMQRLSDAALWFASLLGVCGLLRCGEFAMNGGHSRRERDRRLLRMRHVFIDSAQSRLTVHVPVTKTEQVRGMDVHYARSDSANAQFCPIRCLLAYLRVRDTARAQVGRPPAMADTDAPLLTLDPDARRERPLLRRELISGIRLHLRAAGFTRAECLHFNGHSFKRGGAQSLRDAGMQLSEIKQAGRWKSDAVLRYLTSRADMAASLGPFFSRATTVVPSQPSETSADAATLSGSANESESATDTPSESDTDEADTKLRMRSAAVSHAGRRAFLQLQDSAEAGWGIETPSEATSSASHPPAAPSQ
jgi:hypothetical protein